MLSRPMRFTARSAPPWLPAALLFCLFLIIGGLTLTAPYKVFTFVEPNPGPPYYPAINLLGLGSSLFGWSINYLLTSMLGWVVLKKTVPPTKGAPPLWICAFWIGYLAVCTLTRLAQLVAPHWISYVIVVVGIFLICRGSFRLYFKEIFQTWWTAIPALGLLLVLLVMQVFLVDFQWNGHGPHQYSNEWAALAKHRLPIISQHYDEWIYHSFLIQPFGLLASSILPWWVTLGMMKISIAAFVWLCFCIAGTSRWMAWLGTAFIALGTSSILPDRYFLLFDSANPIFYSVHSGRAVALPMVLLFLLWLKSPALPKTPGSLLVGAGMVATSFSNWLWLAPMKLFDQISQNAGKSYQSLERLAVVAFLLPPVFYISPAKLAFLNLALVLLLYFLILKTLGVKRSWKSIKLKEIWRKNKLFLLAFGGSVLLLGNLFSKALGKPLSKLIRLDFKEIHGTSLRLQGWPDLIKDNREIKELPYNFNSYCYSLADFITCYGAFMCLVILAWSVSKSKGSEWGRKWLVFFMLAWPAFFFLGDFVGHTQRAWILSRFLEVPYYAMLFTSIYLIDQYARPHVRKVVAILMIVYILGPTVGTERPRQWLANFSFLKNMIVDASSDY